MNLRHSLTIACAAALFAGPTHAASARDGGLPRRAGLGVNLTRSNGAIVVSDVTDPAAARAMGLQPGDEILEVDGKTVATPAEAAVSVSLRQTGERGRLQVRRGGKAIVLEGAYAPRAREIYANGVVRYGAVPFEGGLLRDILVTPAGGPTGPVVFLMQGYTCDSMEATQGDPHQQLMEGFLARGISTYRVEKPQVGDSRGGPACHDNDFRTEIRGFEAAYKALRETYGVSPDRIFFLGHSMGGIEAPVIAAAGPAPRGVALYGGVLHAWRDYNLDIVKYQGLTARGDDPANDEAIGEKLRPILERMYAKEESPAVIAAEDPEKAKLLKDWLAWDGHDQFIGRKYTFWSQLSATPLMAAWRDTHSYVLAVYGESDFAAVNAEDHILVADAVNHYRPGTARFVLVPRTGHGMQLDGDRQEARARFLAKAGRAPFNRDLISIFADWIEESMRRPPVAAQPPKA